MTPTVPYFMLARCWLLVFYKEFLGVPEGIGEGAGEVLEDAGEALEGLFGN